mmetsp:Transcript_54354/g.129515  ORF Transcript_54354/g.129515 Transcript_54354/m.129515 type:complete len:343 (-) Transcript_54354:199-1227(-)
MGGVASGIALWPEGEASAREQHLQKTAEDAEEEEAIILCSSSVSTAAFDVNQQLDGAEQADRATVAAVVSQDGRDLRLASDALKADREVVLAAVKQSGWALQFASRDLQGDREIVLEAVATCGEALGCSTEELMSDRELVLTAVRQSAYAIVYADSSLQGDLEIALTAVQQEGMVLGVLPDAIRSNKDVALAAVANCGMALQYVSEPLLSDKDIVWAAVREAAFALTWASGELLEDPDLLAYVKATHPADMQELYLLRISALSGKHCCLVSSPGHCGCYEKSEVLRTSALKLGLDAEHAELYGELLLGASCVQDEDVRGWGLIPGDFNELQLVLTIPPSQFA